MPEEKLPTINHWETTPALGVEQAPDYGSAVEIAESRRTAENQLERAGEAAAPAARPAGQSSSAQGLSWQQVKYRQIESILEEDLAEAYFKMDDLTKQEFKRAGEATALAVLKIISQPRVKIDQILQAIKKWLSIIPQINRFFLEQAAKIKTDKILKLRN